MHTPLRWSAFAALAVVSGCAHSPVPAEPSRVAEYLDNETAMTVRVVTEPFVYGRDVPELAVNARDYLSVGAVELDNMGKHRFFLAIVSWSTIDRARLKLAAPPSPERVEWVATGRARAWPVTTHQPRELGVGMPVLDPPVTRLGDSWVEVKPTDLREMADAPPDSIDVTVNGVRQRYTLWRRGDAALREFAAALPNDMPPSNGRRRRVGT